MTSGNNGYTSPFSLGWHHFPTSIQHYTLPNMVDCILKPLGEQRLRYISSVVWWLGQFFDPLTVDNTKLMTLQASFHWRVILPIKHIQAVLKSKRHIHLKVFMNFKYSLFVHFRDPERLCCSGTIAFGQTWIIPAKVLVDHHFFVIINTGRRFVASILGVVKWLTKVNVMKQIM